MMFAVCAHADISVRDDTGQTVRLTHPAQRIVSLAPHITELLFAAGAGSRIVGSVEFSDYPEAARRIARIGGAASVDLEAVAALRPELVVAWQSGTSPAQVAKIRALGIPLYLSQPNHLEDVATDLERLGALAGTSAVATPAAQQYRARLAMLRQRYQNRPPVRSFYEIWKQPLTTIGGGQIISAVMRVCGGENIFAALPAMAPVVSVESVLAANPEAIIAGGMNDQRPEWLDDWKRWTSLTAVSRDNLFFVPPDLLQRHTPRILDGAEQLCLALETARTRRPGVGK